MSVSFNRKMVQKHLHRDPRCRFIWHPRCTVTIVPRVNQTGKGNTKCVCIITPRERFSHGNDLLSQRFEGEPACVLTRCKKDNRERYESEKRETIIRAITRNSEKGEFQFRKQKFPKVFVQVW